MKERDYRIYLRDVTASPMRRVGAYLIDGLLTVILSFLMIVIGMSALSGAEWYQEHETRVREEMIACYEIEEQAKIYEFTDNDDRLYSHPRPQEELFEAYCLMHILYSYSKDPTPFQQYHITPENPHGIAPASYETDPLAYFYVFYAAEFNDYGGRENDVVDFEGFSPKAYFYKAMKETAVDISMWNFDEQTHELPYLDGYYAVDLYLYLFSENGYEAGLSRYNYLSVNYQNLWNRQVQQLIGSERFLEHYQEYKRNYAFCAYVADGLCFISFLMTFLLVYLAPQLFFRHMQTFGKKLLSLYVVDRDGYELTRGTIAVRNLCMLFLMFGWMLVSCFLAGGFHAGWMYPLVEIGGIGISFFALIAICAVLSGVSLFLMLAHRKKRALQDFIAGTRCIDYRYHIGEEEAKALEEEEAKKTSQSDAVSVQGPYLDSSSFQNTERKDLTDGSRR